MGDTRKKLLNLIGLVLLSSGVAYAAYNTYTPHETGEQSVKMITTTILLTGDCTAQKLPIDLVPGHLYQVELSGTDTNSITCTINSELGAQLYTVTTTSIADGSSEIGYPDFYYWMHEGERPTITVSGNTTGTATIKITSSRDY